MQWFSQKVPFVDLKQMSANAAYIQCIIYYFIENTEIIITYPTHIFKNINIIELFLVSWISKKQFLCE